MKMIKAMKKLKFWSRKKKKRKPFFKEQHPPPCHYHHHCHYYPVEPSAPPLPSWFEYDETQEPILASDQFAATTSVTAGSSRAPFTTEDDRAPELLSSQNSRLQEEINAKSTSYQQYMVQNPIYGVPVVPPPVSSERDAGAVGCVFSFGAHLFRCFFPCFHIREAK